MAPYSFTIACVRRKIVGVTVNDMLHFRLSLTIFLFDFQEFLSMLALAENVMDSMFIHNTPSKVYLLRSRSFYFLINSLLISREIS